MKPSRTVVTLSAAAHLLAWGAYFSIAIGLVLWPAFQGQLGIEWKVLATVFVPVSLTGLGFLTLMIARQRAGDNRDSTVLVVLLAAFCALGIFAVSQIQLPLQIKLLLGIAIASFPIVSIVGVGKSGSVFFLTVASMTALGFCVLAMFSVGIFFLPSALALLASTIIFAVQPRPGVRQLAGV